MNNEQSNCGAPVGTSKSAWVEIPREIFERLSFLGILPPIASDIKNTREYNYGASNYSEQDHVIQPWSIWLDYPGLTSFDHDIIKRVLRSKATDTRLLDYTKIIHICEERIRQLEYEQPANS